MLNIANEVFPTIGHLRLLFLMYASDNNNHHHSMVVVLVDRQLMGVNGVHVKHY
ncbi:MAG: hypothetical protein IT281_10150 [Ignavibacteria bacterium]|nr:hypothetical protein [Ignavibacteria bacterium]